MPSYVIVFSKTQAHNCAKFATAVKSMQEKASCQKGMVKVRQGAESDDRFNERYTLGSGAGP